MAPKLFKVRRSNSFTSKSLLATALPLHVVLMANNTPHAEVAPLLTSTSHRLVSMPAGDGDGAHAGGFLLDISPLASRGTPAASETATTGSAAAEAGIRHGLRCRVLPHKLLVASIRSDAVLQCVAPLLRLMCFPYDGEPEPSFFAFSQTHSDISVIVDEGCQQQLQELGPAMVGAPMAYCAIEVFEGSSALNMTGERVPCVRVCTCMPHASRLLTALPLSPQASLPHSANRLRMKTST